MDPMQQIRAYRMSPMHGPPKIKLCKFLCKFFRQPVQSKINHFSLIGLLKNYCIILKKLNIMRADPNLSFHVSIDWLTNAGHVDSVGRRCGRVRLPPPTG
jgi:hypothetical protein